MMAVRHLNVLPPGSFLPSWALHGDTFPSIVLVGGLESKWIPLGAAEHLAPLRWPFLLSLLPRPLALLPSALG